jgi:hypothetical protein
MKITRLTNGSGSTNSARLIKSRVSGLRSASSNGTLEKLSQKRVPVWTLGLEGNYAASHCVLHLDLESPERGLSRNPCPGFEGFPFRLVLS